jgi:hypothetical protein
MQVSDIAKKLGDLCIFEKPQIISTDRPNLQENIFAYLGFLSYSHKVRRVALSTGQVEHVYVSDWLQVIGEYLMSDTPEANLALAHVTCNSEVTALLTKASMDRGGFADAVCRIRGAH